MKIFGRTTRRGITLPEVVITVGLLSIAVPLMKLAIDWLNNIARQRVMMSAQWEAQVALYDITRAVRNSEAIVSISSDTLVLRVIQPGQMGTFTSAALFDVVNQATMTFSFVSTSTGTYMLRRLESPTRVLETRSLKNMVVAPVGSSYMFHPYPPGATDPPFDAVEIVLRLWPPFMKTGRDQVIEYRSVSMRRARGDQS